MLDWEVHSSLVSFSILTVSCLTIVKCNNYITFVEATLEIFVLWNIEIVLLNTLLNFVLLLYGMVIANSFTEIDGSLHGVLVWSKPMLGLLFVELEPLLVLEILVGSSKLVWESFLLALQLVSLVFWTMVLESAALLLFCKLAAWALVSSVWWEAIWLVLEIWTVQLVLMFCLERRQYWRHDYDSNRRIWLNRHSHRFYIWPYNYQINWRLKHASMKNYFKWNEVACAFKTYPSDFLSRQTHSFPDLLVRFK